MKTEQISAIVHKAIREKQARVHLLFGFRASGKKKSCKKHQFCGRFEMSASVCLRNKRNRKKKRTSTTQAEHRAYIKGYRCLRIYWCLLTRATKNRTRYESNADSMV